ncbi:hypothetical protein PPACK8108_LOCUS13388 [Phakopsora pachyrhizi]|uniref:Phosphatidate phosphatase APP1 catalytic domain-containing protein n=1 Tax=Phakopsora pachyrhizi TaxID=170000 RepID=A0AAV0B5H3_PHAPC|nr:hypothetical protein PPACK8108_LOCUS13388 [Phakopsora pachyrhizi]
MLELAGNWKKARVERIMLQFPESKLVDFYLTFSAAMIDAKMCGRPILCRFICVGDSGDQDLEMYASLAQAYPGRILGIYIRDVTTQSVVSTSLTNQPLINSTPKLTTSTQSSREFFSSAPSLSPLRSSGSNYVLSKTKCTEIGMRESMGNLELLIQIEKSVRTSLKLDGLHHPSLKIFVVQGIRGAKLFTSTSASTNFRVELFTS